MKECNLAQCKPNEWLQVEAISPSDISDKLLEMGLYQGKQISIKFTAPFGDPLAVEIDGGLLSLRRSEAELIIVKRI